MTNTIIQAIGYTAQLIFGIRFFIQWLSSEKTGKVQSPAIFWQLSLFASVLLFLYSVLVRDLPIMLGQSLGYFIYVRNLQLSNVWKKFPSWFRFLIKVIPVISFIIVISGQKYSLQGILANNSNVYLLLWGIAGQLVFTSRFIYQWLHSEKIKQSVFPVGFWIFSISGAILISSYAWYMQLYPIIIGHSIGMIVYIRNLMIHYSILSKSANDNA